MEINILFWIGFNAFIILMLALDLGVFHRKAHEVGFKEAITDNPFIVYTSNVLAILGLRSLYFALAGILKYFHYLHYGLAAILVFVGIKMLITDFYKFDPFVSLGIIALILIVSIVLSVLKSLKGN